MEKDKPMASMDHATIEDWLQRELDGDLSAAETERLTAALEASPGARAERAAYARLAEALGERRIAVGEGFRERVMASLPPAGWEGRAARAWRLPLALLAAFGAAAAVLLRFASGSSVGGSLAAVAGLFKTALLAGGGMLTHTWSGLRMAVGELVSTSPAGAVGLAVLFAGLCLLTALSLRRRVRRAVPAEGGEKPSRPPRA